MEIPPTLCDANDSSFSDFDYHYQMRVVLGWAFFVESLQHPMVVPDLPKGRRSEMESESLGLDGPSARALLDLAHLRPAS